MSCYPYKENVSCVEARDVRCELCLRKIFLLPVARAVEFQAESLLYDPIVDFQQNHDDLNECLVAVWD